MSASGGTWVQQMIVELKQHLAHNLIQPYICRAWVNFNGTGTVAIRESGNVSSITDNRERLLYG